jgi:nitrile hydratase accessory protein
MDGAVDPPRVNGELVFDAPWQGRACGLAVALTASLGIEWDCFRQELVAAVGEDPGRAYYESWISALESLVVSVGITSAEELQRRRQPLGVADESDPVVTSAGRGRQSSESTTASPGPGPSRCPQGQGRSGSG